MTHTIVMTGATRGLGRVAVERIREGDPEAHLVLLARGAAGAEFAAHLGQGGRAVTSIPTDLLSLGSVRRAADELIRRLDTGDLPPLSGFVGNAGLLYTNNVTKSPDGVEATFAVNVLANHLLLRLLQDRFKAPSRIVLTVSDAHFGDFRHNAGMMPAPSWQDPANLARIRAFPNPHTVTAGGTAYSTSKLAAIYLIHEYARRLPPGVEILAFNPGFVPGTGLSREASAAVRFVGRRIMPLMTLTPLASSQKTAGQHLADVVLGRIPAPSGSYIDRTREVSSSKESYDPDRERQLWETVEELRLSIAS
ncbi:SDR family NAD(P)-dependent oxidoreductase [Micromonospora sp. WMMD882]|uniref:SDR family NAD(P)-dependent oxidoreductase n=1 Tax=Micromonospora sp. WMMD882 TaxID=3015151 RepID=UPI00248C9041|nr:SDR family NAD(P)-dependent oxidoreductase [Micromonospora sp. WMMD882]WBB77905.1 SDR family NAD(P)-dependent oxidoreductase [Micromonospora sp. WMMD882]